MTIDTDEHNSDPYKIDIKLENDKDNKLKRFFEKGLNALLDDKYFLLLHVPENGNKMQVIRPATNSYHRKRIVKRINEAKRIPSFYYALSHLWGLTEDNRYHWNDISEYVDDEEGQPMKPVSMRPEKRDTLLAMLKDHPDSYWWIDVLCARTDTPLDIMGDIYTCCLECIAMIDCDPDTIPKLHTMLGARDEFPDQFWTIDYRNPDSYLPYKQIYDEKCPQMMDTLCTLQQSSWWTRVWTWQEMALPFGDVRLMSETGAHQPSCNTITLDNLYDRFSGVAAFLIFYGREQKNLNEKDALLHEKAEVVSSWLGGITDARGINKDRLEPEMSGITIHDLILSLGESTRRCYDPCDYVYGVLGMLQIKIPRMADADEVWDRFLDELDDYIDNLEDNELASGALVGTSDRARQINLLEAKNMKDVYNDLLVIEEDEFDCHNFA